MIRELRKLGGRWVAERQGFGVYIYRGEWLGSAWEIRSYAHLSPGYDGDDESYAVRWHITKDGVPWGFQCNDPAYQLMAARAA